MQPLEWGSIKVRTDLLDLHRCVNTHTLQYSTQATWISPERKKIIAVPSSDGNFINFKSVFFNPVSSCFGQDFECYATSIKQLWNLKTLKPLNEWNTHFIQSINFEIL